MWREVEKPKIVRVTKAIAREWNTMTPVPNDRPLKELRLSAYRRMFAAGHFRSVEWAKSFCRETGETYRINGKHTSTLLLEMDTIPEFYASLQSFESDTLKDVAHLYSTFDSRNQMRTASDINRSFAASVKELEDFPNWLLTVLVTGISYAESQENAFSLSAVERAEKMLDHVEFALWLSQIIDHQARKQFIRVPVVAAMLLTWEKSRKAATEFWTSVREETGVSPDLPDRKLAKWLSQSRILETNSRLKGTYSKAARREFLVRSLHAWNAWRKNEKTELRYYPEKKVPSVA